MARSVSTLILSDLLTPEFEQALAFAFKWEVGSAPDGGYTNDPDDPGGETKWGVSKRSYPETDIAALTRDQAERIYLEDYWLSSGRQRSGCDRLPYPLSVAHFDCVVNVGNWKTTQAGQPLYHGRATMILQRALGADDDGLIGPLTLADVARFDPIEVARWAIRQRDLYYATLGAWARKYQQGWLRRTNDLRRELHL